MATHVKSVTATGVYGRFDLSQELQPGVNVIYGKNGTGKTTFLHILANLLNADYQRFAFLKFNTATVELDDGTRVEVVRRQEEKDSWIDVFVNGEKQTSFSVGDLRHRRSIRYRETQQKTLFEESDEDISSESFLPADYFPAFRTMIEAWASVQDEQEPYRHFPQRRKAKATKQARELFGYFLPTVIFPSPIEIEQRLGSEIQAAVITIAQSDQELLSKAFLDIFGSLAQGPSETLEPPEQILDHINSLYESLEESPIYADSLASISDVYTKLRQQLYTFRIQGSINSVRILDVYRNALVERIKVLKDAFAVINRYLDAVNEFFEGKKIEIVFARETRLRSPLVGIRFEEGFSAGLRTLSSGERQIVTLIYAATHMNEQRVVLIDEPELSLHVDWQRLLLSKMAEQLQDRQIIACTHSPVIAADYEDRMKELKINLKS